MNQEIYQDRIRLQNFHQRLNQAPDPKEILVNKNAGNIQYLPISFLEMALDELFFGLWETSNFRWDRQGNELVGSIDLKVFHPVANIWITRTGAAATMIRLKKESKSYELENKIHNALEMDFPHLKADCLRNAVQSLGKIFGRDLNRLYTDQFKPIIHQHEISNGAQTTAVLEASELQKSVSACEERMERCRMDDATEIGFKARISRTDNARDVWQIYAELENYIPESIDPQQQFKSIAKNL